MSAIVSVMSHNNGIGYQGNLCVRIPSDMKRFNRLTMGVDTLPNLVVMGYKTYKSLPVFPLPGRHNVVITRHHIREFDELRWPLTEATVVSGFIELEELLRRTKRAYGEVWYIGGTRIYREAVHRGLIKHIHVTEVEPNNESGKVPADAFFDVSVLTNARVIYSERHPGIEYNITFKTYAITHNSEERAYLALLDRLLRQPLRRTRSGNTRALFGESLRFDLHENGFPLLTTKRMPAKAKTIEKELLFFLRGQTNVALLQAQGVHIWDGNTTAAFLKDKALRENDMGPLYGFNWRNYGAAYTTCEADYTGQGVDQLRGLIKSIRTDPFSRRHLMTSYDPVTAESACLYPCHSIVIQCFVREGGFLDLVQYQRSADAFLGLPFNIASSAILLLLLAQQTDLRPGRLTLQLGDAHLYETHEVAARTQLRRQPRAFPKYKIDKQDSIEKYDLEHFHLIDYTCHPRIRAPMAV